MELFFIFAISSLVYTLSDNYNLFSKNLDSRKEYACQSVDHHLSSYSFSMFEDLVDLPVAKQTTFYCSLVIQPSVNTPSFRFKPMLQNLDQKPVWSLYIEQNIKRSLPKLTSQLLDEMNQAGIKVKEPIEVMDQKQAFASSSKDVLYLFAKDGELRFAIK